MTDLVAIVGLCALAWAIFSFVRMLVTKGKRRRFGLHALGALAVMIFLFSWFGEEALDRRAQEAGFKDYQHQRQVETARREAAEELQAEKDAARAAEAAAEKERAEKAERAARLRAEAEKEEACRQDLRCTAETNMVETTLKCARVIERMAKYDYEWTGTTTTEQFSRFKWQDQETGVVTYWGDRIKFQNGFGAWSHMIYECDAVPEAKMLLDVRVEARN